MAGWKFITNHAQVLLCVAHDPEIRLREIAEACGITERAAHRIVADLEEAGYISRERIGRRNRYEFHAEIVMRHPPMGLAPDIRMGDLVAPLMARSRSNGAAARSCRRRKPAGAGRQVENYPPCSPVPGGCSLLEPSHHWLWKRFICRISKPCESMMFSDMRRSSAWMPDRSSARAILIAPSW